MENKIEVIPYIPDEDYDNPAMVVDFYEFTMANCLFLHGYKDPSLPSRLQLGPDSKKGDRPSYGFPKPFYLLPPSQPHSYPIFHSFSAC